MQVGNNFCVWSALVVILLVLLTGWLAFNTAQKPAELKFDFMRKMSFSSSKQQIFFFDDNPKVDIQQSEALSSGFFFEQSFNCSSGASGLNISSSCVSKDTKVIFYQCDTIVIKIDLTSHKPIVYPAAFIGHNYSLDSCSRDGNYFSVKIKESSSNLLTFMMIYNANDVFHTHLKQSWYNKAPCRSIAVSNGGEFAVIYFKDNGLWWLKNGTWIGITQSYAEGAFAVNYPFDSIALSDNGKHALAVAESGVDHEVFLSYCERPHTCKAKPWRGMKPISMKITDAGYYCVQFTLFDVACFDNNGDFVREHHFNDEIVVFDMSSHGDTVVAITATLLTRVSASLLPILDINSDPADVYWRCSHYPITLNCYNSTRYTLYASYYIDDNALFTTTLSTAYDAPMYTIRCIDDENCFKSILVSSTGIQNLFYITKKRLS